jgi:hypothetical protein
MQPVHGSFFGKKSVGLTILPGPLFSVAGTETRFVALY